MALGLVSPVGGVGKAFSTGVAWMRLVEEGAELMAQEHAGGEGPAGQGGSGDA